MPPTPLSEFLPCHLLIADDDPMMREIARDHFQQIGFSVVCATNGREALERMEEQLPELVLCDRLMPEMSGADLLSTVRARGPEWQAVAFVFMTALSDRRDRYAMLPLHPDGYLCKPIDFSRADAEIAVILKSRREHRKH